MEFSVNIAAVIAAAFANFFVGAIWYTPLFGKTWAKELGLNTGVKPDGKFMAPRRVFPGDRGVLATVLRRAGLRPPHCSIP